jgi:hypothetical protein
MKKQIKKRIGRPTKRPKSGQRVPLGLRVTPEMKTRLERAATKRGRSLSQEAELMLERSLDLSRHLVIAQGDWWCPVLIHRGELLIALGDKPDDYPRLPSRPPRYRPNVIRLQIEEEDLKRLQNYLGGATYPYECSVEEVEEAGQQWIEMQIDKARGK